MTDTARMNNAISANRPRMEERGQPYNGKRYDGERNMHPLFLRDEKAAGNPAGNPGDMRLVPGENDGADVDD